VTSIRSDISPAAAADWGAPSEIDSFGLLRRIFRSYLAPRWKVLALSIGSMILVAATTSLLPILLQSVADDIFDARDERMLYLLPPAIVIVFVVRSLADYVARVSEASIGNRLVADLRGQLFEKLAGADLGYLQRTHSAKFISVFMTDAQVVNSAAAQTLTAFASSALQVVFLAGTMLMFDPLLGTIALGALPFGVLLLRRQRSQMTSSVNRTLQGTGDLSSIVSQTLQGIRVVKAYDREAAMTGRARAIIDRTFDSIMQTTRMRAMSGPVAESLAGIGIAAAIFYGGVQGLKGGLSDGDFMGVIAAALLMYRPLKSLAGIQNVLYEGLIAAKRVFAILDADPNVVEKPAARPLVVTGGAIKFENVSFSYEHGKPVVDRVTLDIPPGHKVALVGPSGGGKSTLMNLVLRFYDPEIGRVLIDGQDVGEATVASVRKASALLTQEPVLFDDTVRSNIAYGSEEASEEAIIASAKAADAHEFIMRLPLGYETRVGEGGGLLSGGQKQRIAIARAMLRDAPILLLDEPTSALDAEAEARIQSALANLFGGRTVLMIAHRLSTVKKADLICVVDKGRIVESGTHDELVARDGLYANLNRTQLLGEQSAREEATG